MSLDVTSQPPLAAAWQRLFAFTGHPDKQARANAMVRWLADHSVHREHLARIAMCSGEAP
jgi:hypothetical protein